MIPVDVGIIYQIPPNTADGYLATYFQLELPRRVYCSALDLCALVKSSIDKWNSLRPGLFEMSDDPNSPVVVMLTDGRTWVSMPVSDNKATLYIGPDVDIEYWMPHELGHALGLADHVYPNQDLTGYVNPKFTTDGYRGVMAYGVPPVEWFGSADSAMLHLTYPMPVRAYFPI